VKKYKKIIKKIDQHKVYFSKFRDEDFRTKTDLLKMRLRSGDSFFDLLPETYALAREAIKRVLAIDVFDVQLMGAISANEEKIVEMKTGEGKTLTIIFPAFLRSLSGKGVHIITSNDYLAERDAIWMQRVYKLLGVSIGYITQNSSDFDRQVAYMADVVYLTGSEAGFDYLKDNMSYDKKTKRQRGFNFAIIDEADSVLIDEAQTPLVISSPLKEKRKEEKIFQQINQYIKHLKKNLDFKIDKKNQTVFLTIQGINKLEKLVNVENLYGNNDEDYLYYFERLLKAYYLFKKDKDYVIEDGKVVIVDEFTGRLMPEHRYFQGLHQAIETKEEIEIKAESETLAITTFQNFFQKYEGFTGFTGTAYTAEKEFRMIYKKEVEVIPTNKPIERMDLGDMFFVNWTEKVNYLAWETQEHFFKKRAVLIGTRSVLKSSDVQKVLAEENIPSNVLNAKHTAREAEIISQAGQPQTITVATNMAGRGTDIELDEEVKKTGGLHVIGMDRHNTRRIDNQLIGRSGRQGDVGQTRFLISADDEIFKTHFKEEYLKKIRKFRNTVSGVESMDLEKLLQKAQRRMEDLFLDQRILNFEFDKILERQRQSFYQQRERILNDSDLRKETVNLLKEELFREAMDAYSSKRKNFNQTNLKKINKKANDFVGSSWFKLFFGYKKSYNISKVREKIYLATEKYYNDFESRHGTEKIRKAEKVITLKVLDLVWRNHLRKAEDLQEAALIDSLGGADFYDNYVVEMTKAYKKMLLSVPRILARTFFCTIKRMWEDKKINEKS
jgi:preprotein translocase subunit SecA